MPRPRVPEDEQAVKRSISLDQATWDRLRHFCETNEWQPSASHVIRKALIEFLDKNE